MLRGQCVRSGGGLYYENVDEFCEGLFRLEASGPMGAALGRHGRAYFHRHYTWPVIERKYLNMFDRLATRAGGRPRRARARDHRAALPDQAARGRRAGHAAIRSGGALVPRVHQVLASLGYGDAIGNSVLGIRRVLRAAGFESRIYVETADPRLEDETSDYRDMVDEVEDGDLLLHHFSLGSRASRTAYALPCRMMLMYHNITPPEYFVGVHPWLVRQCYHGRRELGAYASRVSLAAGASEFNRRELEALGFPDTAVLPVVPDFSHLGGVPDAARARRLR